MGVTTSPTTSTGTAATGGTQNDTAVGQQSFLQNKSLAGGVFAVVGIVAAILIIFLVTYTVRRRRRKSLEDEIVDAVSWPPHRHSHHSFEDNTIRDAGNNNSNYGGEKGDWRSETGSMTQGYGGAQAYGQRPLPPSALYQQQPGYGQGQQAYPFSTPYAVQQYQSASGYGAPQQAVGRSNATAQTAAQMALPERFGQENALSRSGTLDRGDNTFGGNLTVANE